MNICISREFGSGGHEIGKILAEQLGYSFYDRRLLEGAAEKSRIPIEHLERADEQKAEEMDQEAQEFRRITMKVLTMQLNSTSVMDIVAYGGAAAGMIVAASLLSMILS